ncbi:MAG TPA: endonuclease/exonuclease/phosphatase family protein [Flavobacteriia bacterium]|jgi:predicted extracellular nuclease|nr:endonuclease/exonuclease/phosphatase family protein [Flavobacteriia bacterium]
MKSIRLFLIVVLFSTISVFSQQKKYLIRTVAFYNLENLFDTINDPQKLDERSPIMEMNAKKRGKAYLDKLDNMAKVISEIGKEKAHTAPAIIGVSEIENKQVLEDLVHNEKLKKLHYGVIHYDSPDARGIDVALLYQKRYFKPISSKTYELKLRGTDGKPYATRDQLLVTGMLDDELIHVIVNHWPSRRGGEQKSRPSREKAAALTLKIIEDVKKEYPNPKIIIMGDLNDDPINSSLRKILHTKAKKSDVKDGGIYNPMNDMFRRGLSTLGYRDNINLFDQIMVTSPLVTTKKDFSTYKLYKANIFNPRYLTQKTGRYKGYPFRSWGGGDFTGGYSDHYPVYIYLLKEKK